MAHSDYEGSFHEYLQHLAVVAAFYESEGCHNGSNNNLTLALKNLEHSTALKNSLEASLQHAYREIHDFIGTYGFLITHGGSEVGETLHGAVRAGEGLEDFAHKHHLNAMLNISEARREEIRNGYGE